MNPGRCSTSRGFLLDPVWPLMRCSGQRREEGRRAISPCEPVSYADLRRQYVVSVLQSGHHCGRGIGATDSMCLSPWQATSVAQRPSGRVYSSTRVTTLIGRTSYLFNRFVNTPGPATYHALVKLQTQPCSITRTSSARLGGRARSEGLGNCPVATFGSGCI